MYKQLAPIEEMDSAENAVEVNKQRGTDDSRRIIQARIGVSVL